MVHCLPYPCDSQGSAERKRKSSVSAWDENRTVPERVSVRLLSTASYSQDEQARQEAADKEAAEQAQAREEAQAREQQAQARAAKVAPPR